MRNEQKVAKLVIIKEKVKSHPEEAEQLLTNLIIQLMTRRTRPRTVQVISIGQRPAAQLLPKGKSPSGEVKPTTWHPASQVLPSKYFEYGVDMDEVWDGEIQNFRLPTPAEQETIISANIKRYQQQPIIEVATDSGPDEGIRTEICEHESPGFLRIDTVRMGKLRDNSLILDQCPPDESQENHLFKYPILKYNFEENPHFASFWTEIVGEIFNPDISVKGEVPSYLKPYRKTLCFIKPALNQIQNLPDECGCSLNNDRMAWFKHWATKAVALYDNTAFIEFSSWLEYARHW